MALIRINAEGRKPVLHGTDAPLSPVLNRALETTGPITVMLHGYKFQPNSANYCPHAHIFAPIDAACTKAVSWPDRLGFLSQSENSGVGIAFGWQARGTSSAHKFGRTFHGRLSGTANPASACNRRYWADHIPKWRCVQAMCGHSAANRCRKNRRTLQHRQQRKHLLRHPV